MNMKRLLALLLALCMALALCACGNNAEPEAAPEAAPEAVPEAAPEVIPEVEPETEEEATEAAPAGIVYTVNVTDEGGNPISGAMIQLCQGEMCLMPAATDDNGVVTFSVAEEAAYEAKFLALPAGYDYTSEEQVFHFDGALEITIVLKAVA